MDNENVDYPLCVKLTLASGKDVILPCVVLDEERADGSVGTDPEDRILVEICDSEQSWIERRDLCGDDGERIKWVPYEEEMRQDEDRE